MAIAHSERFVQADEIEARRFQQRFCTIAENVAQAVVTSETTIHMALLGLFAEGHVLLEDRPGVGKTLLAKCIASSVNGVFTRIQFTPDLLPTDITGASVFDPQDRRFDFMPGPVFANVLLADELNRTNPRTQSALLEAMAEGQVTVDGTTRLLPQPFVVFATQNSLDSSGTFPLPDTELDRFLVRVSLGLPSADDEMEILLRSEHGTQDVGPVLEIEDVLAMRRFVRQVDVARPLKEYMVNLANQVRHHAGVRGGMSPRGTVLLQRAAQGWAAFQGRDFVMPEDVQAVAINVLAHRITVDGRQNDLAVSVVRESVASVPVPL